MGVNLTPNASYGVLEKVDKDSQVVHQDKHKSIWNQNILCKDGEKGIQPYPSSWLAIFNPNRPFY